MAKDRGKVVATLIPAVWQRDAGKRALFSNSLDFVQAAHQR